MQRETGHFKPGQKMVNALRLIKNLLLFQLVFVIIAPTLLVT